LDAPCSDYTVVGVVRRGHRCRRKREAMMSSVTTKTMAAAFAALSAATLAVAQAPPQVRVRATIDSVQGQTLDVKSRDGAMMKVQLVPNAPVNEVVKASLSDIKKGDYIAVTAMPQPDGSQKAAAILIFPEAMRGVAEGFRPWDLSPQSTMTNATVANQVTSADAQKLTVNYKDGEKTVIVPPSAEIVTYKKAS